MGCPCLEAVTVRQNQDFVRGICQSQQPSPAGGPGDKKRINVNSLVLAHWHSALCMGQGSDLLEASGLEEGKAFY